MWLLWVIIVGLIAGWAAGKIMKGSGYGTLGDILLGIVGGVIGGFSGSNRPADSFPALSLRSSARCY